MDLNVDQCIKKTLEISNIRFKEAEDNYSLRDINKQNSECLLFSMIITQYHRVILVKFSQLGLANLA